MPREVPIISTEDEWRQFRVFNIHQQTRHLDAIRTYTGWLLALVVAGIVLSVLLTVIGMVATASA